VRRFHEALPFEEVARRAGVTVGNARALMVEKEAKILANLDHRNVVKVHAWRQAGGEHSWCWSTSAAARWRTC
jgi:hypothetical protein